MLPVVGGGIALAGIGAGCATGVRWGAVGFSQPDGATGSASGCCGVLLRGFGRACGSGFHSVGRE
ncbi:hypothetical protein BAR24066_05314 [Burkholderia arboris]|uniref:Uncharacterized protein n=1 Tax=Burkholderia arboris TaxID=488730 RepID=A0A9Q9UT40_9BURK|nr:hypothetical protein BAR24066_05314 [Burkholderia arboris]